jgi:hypothetical protein
MRWSSERRWQLRVEVTLRRVELGLGEKDAAGEVGTPEVSAPEVRPGEVGHSQVGASEVSSDEACPSQVGPPEVRAPEILPHEVGPSPVDLMAPGPGSHQFARTKQQRIHISSVYGHVQFDEIVGTAVGETFGLIERQPQLTMEGARRWQRQRFGQMPEELMELPHDREHLEHLHRDSRRPPPVLAAEGYLGDLLPRAKAVIHGAPREAPLPEAVVNGAAEVRLQIRAGLPGLLVDGEVRRG